MFRKTVIIAALLATATGAQAATFAYQQNRAGGSIVLTDQRGYCTDGGLVAYSTQASGANAQVGCWNYFEPTITVTWKDGNISNYDISNFTPTAYARKAYNKGQ